MDAILGIDGGGTHTRASLVAGEKVLAYGESGSIKRLRVGAGTAEANLRALLQDVFMQAGPIRVSAASCGVAGAIIPGVAEWITEVFREFGIERSEVVGDHVIALDAAFHGGPGILQAAGTGSNTVGRAPDGSYENVGGWSSRLGDEGSGYWIGINAVRRALIAYDREQPTEVLKRVGEAWGTHTVDELIDVGDGTPAPDFSLLAPVVYELAEAGDAVALDVIRQAAADIVAFVLLARDKLRRRHNVAEEVPVAWTGSVIEKMKLVRESFFAGLKKGAPEMPVLKEGVVSLDGALWRAKRMAE